MCCRLLPLLLESVGRIYGIVSVGRSRNGPETHHSPAQEFNSLGEFEFLNLKGACREGAPPGQGLRSNYYVSPALGQVSGECFGTKRIIKYQ